MRAKTPRCTRCNLELAPGEDRCPRCLRKSTVVDPNDAPTSHDGSEPDGIPKHVGIRLGLAIGMLTLGVAVASALISYEAWFKAHDLWIAAIAVVMGLTTMPVRVAFQPMDWAMTSREAFRHYGLLMAGVTASTMAFAVVLAVVWQFCGDSIASIFLGLLLFLLLLLCLPLALAAIWRRDPVGKTVKLLAKNAGLAVAIVAMVAALVWLRTLKSGPPKQPLVIVEDPKALLDPLDLGSVRVVSQTTLDEDGRTTLNVQADGGDLKRTLAKLYVESLMSVDKVRKDPNASGRVICWIPQRLRSPENVVQVRDEERTINSAIASGKMRTVDGNEVRVAFEFGEIPIRD